LVKNSYGDTIEQAVLAKWPEMDSEDLIQVTRDFMNMSVGTDEEVEEGWLEFIQDSFGESPEVGASEEIIQ
jgi:hypothetical protein